MRISVQVTPVPIRMLSVACAIPPSVDQTNGLWPCSLTQGWKWSEMSPNVNPARSAICACRTSSFGGWSSEERAKPSSMRRKYLFAPPRNEASTLGGSSRRRGAAGAVGGRSAAERALHSHTVCAAGGCERRADRTTPAARRPALRQHRRDGGGAHERPAVLQARGTGVAARGERRTSRGRCVHAAAPRERCGSALGRRLRRRPRPVLLDPPPLRPNDVFR